MNNANSFYQQPLVAKEYIVKLSTSFDSCGRNYCGIKIESCFGRLTHTLMCNLVTVGVIL